MQTEVEIQPHTHKTHTHTHRREVVDAYLRDRAVEFGAISINGLVTDVVLPEGNSATSPYTIKYSNYDGKKTGTPETLEVDAFVGAGGANSRLKLLLYEALSH